MFKDSPRIIKTQMNISTKLHRELTCEICSIPKSSIFWFQNGNQLVSNQNYFIKFYSKLIDNEQCTTTTLIIHVNRHFVFFCLSNNFPFFLFNWKKRILRMAKTVDMNVEQRIFSVIKVNISIHIRKSVKSQSIDFSHWNLFGFNFI